MTLKKIGLCAIALVAVTIASQLAQAGRKAGGPNLGVSASSPGHQLPPPTGQPAPGKSEFAPGDIKQDKDLKNAKTLAPGFENPNKK